MRAPLAQQAGASYLSSEEMDDGTTLILMARTSVKLTNGRPKLGKPLAGVKQGQAPLSSTSPLFQNKGPCQAPTWQWV